MANFGLQRLVLADPVTHDFRGAEKTAVGAEKVLESMAIAATIPEALKDVVYAVGTTSRGGLKRFTPLSPEEGARRLREHSARGRVALVLGGEKRGLSDDELAHCHDVIVIDTHDAQPSMNLAQAAAVLLYLCPRAPGAAPAEPGADGALLQRLEAKLREALTACEYLNPQAPEHALKELTRSLVRGGLSKREAEMWLAAFEHVRRSVKRGP
jgi:tRNA/rRNA methyltransferase